MKAASVTGDDKPVKVVLYKTSDVRLDDPDGVLRM
jgi:hypothetical protein